MEISPLGGALGAEIHDIKLNNLDAAIIEAIRTAFHEYLVLVFPNQNLTPADQIAFTENFGPVEPHPLRTRDSVAGFPQVLVLENRPGRPGAPNDYWHSDISHAVVPPAATVLHALVIPEGHSDTLFCNMVRAYETLSTGLKAAINNLHALHSGHTTYERSLGKNDARPINPAEVKPPQVHPVVRTLPGSGKRALFVNPHFTIGLENMTVEESAPILDVLYKAAIRPENIYRHRWRPGDVVIWDNRSTMHYAVLDYTEDMLRKMHRTTAGGEIPR